MGGGSSSSYSEQVIRRPDDVKIADINSKKDIKLAELEIEFKKEATKAQIELMETHARLSILFEETRLANMKLTGEALTEFANNLNILAVERIAVLQSNSLVEIHEVNRQYKKVIDEIYFSQKEFMLNELPQLTDTLNSMEKGSDSYNIYKSTVDLVASEYVKGISERVKSAREQNNQLIQSNTKLKELIVGSTQSIIKATMSNSSLLIQERPLYKELNQEIRNPILNMSEEENSLEHLQIKQIDKGK